MVSAMVKSSLRKHEKTDKSFVIYIFIVILPIFIFFTPKTWNNDIKTNIQPSYYILIISIFHFPHFFSCRMVKQWIVTVTKSVLVTVVNGYVNKDVLAIHLSVVVKALKIIPIVMKRFLKRTSVVPLWPAMTKSKKVVSWNFY